MFRGENLTALPAVWGNTAVALARHPVVLVPFAFLAVVDAALLFLVFLAPQQPVSAVLAPVVRAFWGEYFLHYPANFLLLPTLFSYARNLSGFVTGVAFSGMAAALIMQAHRGGQTSWMPGIRSTAAGYFKLAAVWALMLCLIPAAAKIAALAGTLIHVPAVDPWISHGASLLLQGLLVFSIPAVVIERRKLLPAIGRSFCVWARYPLASLTVALVPLLLIAPLEYLRPYILSLMARTPEAAFGELGLRIIAFTAADALSISSATMLLLHYGEEERRGCAV